MTNLTALIAILASLAALGQAADSCSKDVKVSSQGDLDAIKSCKEYKGTITIDNTPLEQLRLEGVQTLQGDLLVQKNEALRSFSAPQLQAVQGHLKIHTQVQMNKLDMPALTEAKQLTLAVLPVLEHIQFPAKLTKVEDVRIEDIRASGIDGFEPASLNSLTLTENSYIKSFKLSVQELLGSLYVTANGHDLAFEAPELTSVQNATFRDLASLSMPKLTQVSSDISFHQNAFDKLNLDSVQLIGGTLSIANNDKLTETSLKSVERIGGALSIGNNTQLTAISGFPKLSEVDGTVDVAGGFDQYELPQLQDVRGGMRIQTTSSRFPCPDTEKKLKMTNVVKGSIWSCQSSMNANDLSPTVGQPKGGSISGGSNGGPNSNNSKGSSNTNQSALSSASSLSAHGSWLALAAGIAFAAVSM
ncbi:hypothetical protein BCR43DRAFT_539255 [Syncephalastrum racemosum]|uniref:Receptor L-domain domain-containing protein n=1 Tax=Syncephalastrum racemosum TaxID=13706 RepID=A0A1X2GZA9_SYNRA|nr:hypothetical protein BCR43DRAFT_539255 [Syncephalastrum racemosum]